MEEKKTEMINDTETPAKETEQKKTRTKKLSVKRIIGIAVCAVLLAAGSSAAIIAMMPYGIVVDGEQICTVDSRDDASDAIAKALGGLAEEGSQVKVFECSRDIDVVRLNTLKKGDVLTVADAAGKLGELFSEGSEGQASVTVVSAVVGEHAFTPEPEYVKDTSMVAGTARTVEEGQDGMGKYLYTYTTVDGDKEETQEQMLEVLDEGKSEVIAKGTVGLPPGEDWETYEGDPIFSSGEALVATAKKYKGAPYKWGGTNLKTGVSCIGFVKAIYKMYGIKIPMSHPLLKKFGVGVAYKDAMPGDIICYKEHTGIYIGGGKMIDAASNRGVGIAKVRPGNVVTVRRVPKS